MQENISTLDRQKKFIIQFLYWGILTGVILLFGKYILPVLIPFIVALLVAAILNKPIYYISEKLKIKRKIVSVIVLLLFLCCSSIVVSCFCTLVLSLIEKIFLFLPDLFTNFIIPFIEQAFAKLDLMFGNMDLSLLDILQANTAVVLDSIYQAVSHFSNGILSSLANIISLVPALFIQTVITIIAMFFITLDFENIAGFFKKQIPETKKELVAEAKTYFIKTLPKFIASYGVIVCLTFTELFLGFLFLKIPYASLIAVLIAVLDILPILGTGTILVPWGIINLITGNYGLAMGLFLLYLVITVIRNIVEPRLIGKQMGLHPVVTLASMLVGLKLFGIWGLLGVPVGISFLKKIKDKGALSLEEEVKKMD